jgi:hypothetical protein
LWQLLFSFWIIPVNTGDLQQEMNSMKITTYKQPVFLLFIHYKTNKFGRNILHVLSPNKMHWQLY